MKTALDSLPWFARDESGRLMVKNGAVGPVVDLHTHLAMGAVLPFQAELLRESAYVEHYLPGAEPADLDCYANSNFSADGLRRMKRDLLLANLGAGHLRRTHTVPNLLAEMRGLGVVRAVSLPIDFPFLSRNTEATLTAVAGREELIPFASVHPLELRPEERLDAHLHRGARGLKVHPAVQLVRPDAPSAMRLYRACGDRGVPVLWHCGPVGIEPRLSRWLSQVRFYERPIAACPRTTFVLGHAGARQAEEALRLHRSYPNVFLELSSQGLPWVRRILDEGDPLRIVFGSDWPFYAQGLSLAKVLLATEGRPALRHQVLYGNAARLLGLRD